MNRIQPTLLSLLQPAEEAIDTGAPISVIDPKFSAKARAPKILTCNRAGQPVLEALEFLSRYEESSKATSRRTERSVDSALAAIGEYNASTTPRFPR